jgi:hypothetical protein
MNPMHKAPSFIAPLRAVTALALLALAGFGLAPGALAQANANPPERMTYQGFLVDANGTPLGTNAPRNYDVIFRIWSSESGTGAGDRLWTEQQTVTVDKGYFSVLLGEGSSIGEARPALSAIFTNANASDRWVGLTVKGIGAGGTDVNILPRLRLLTSPYAFLASRVSGAGVVTATNLAPALSNALWTANGANIYRSGGNVGIGTATPGASLEVAGGIRARGGAPGGGGANNNGYAFSGNSGDDDSGMFSSADGTLQFFTDSVERLRIASGNVVIGTTTPSDILHVRSAYPRVRAESSGSGYAGFLSKNSNAEWFAGIEGGASYWQLYENSPSFGARLVVASGGNVGIGTTAPAVRLDVNGTMRVNNGLVGAPANGEFGNNGTRITLWPGSASSTPFAFGIDNSTLWSSVPAGNVFRWYQGTTSKMLLAGDGALHLQDGGTGTGARLRVNSGGWSDVAVTFRALSTDNHTLDLQDSGGNIRFIFGVNGTPYRTGGTTWAIWSDARLKQNVDDLQGALDQMLRLHSVNFEYRDGDRYGQGRQRGFLAQEVQKVFPDWVSTAPDGMLAVECKGFEALTVEALRELRTEKDQAIQRLSEENAALKTSVTAQQARLAALEELVRTQLQSAVVPKSGPSAASGNN